MKNPELRLVIRPSSFRPGKISIGLPNDPDGSLRDAFKAAGFEVGDEVQLVLIKREQAATEAQKRQCDLHEDCFEANAEAIAWGRVNGALHKTPDESK